MLLSLLASVSSFPAHAKVYKRVVVLAPAAVDIFEKLDAADLIVGVTKNVKGLPHAKRVGSHIRPNLELIAALSPDLIVISSNRFFAPAFAKKLNADIFYYNPVTLEGIIAKIEELAGLIGREDKAYSLVRELKNKLSSVKPLKKSPRVVYEVMEHPLIFAGKKNIVADIIQKAGGTFLPDIPKKFVRFSYERILVLKPDIYIYQVGPMNKNPTPPLKRPYLKGLKAVFLRVNELDFSRPNTRSFDNVLFLNRVFYELEE